MKKVSLRILRRINCKGEITLTEAVKMGKPSCCATHLHQYPLTILIEDGYLGMTLNYTPPHGAEDSREYGLSTYFHQLTLPMDEDGAVKYGGSALSGEMDTDTQKVFIKAKGSLYLEELNSKRWDRILSVVVGIVVGIVVAWFSTWFASTVS